MNKSTVRYNPPQERYVRVSNSIVDKLAPDVIGIYCKLIKISYGKTLSIDIISKRINISEKKVRKVIVELEEAGYVVREPIKNEQNKMCGWDYQIYADPVPEEQRSHAGKKKQKTQIPVLPDFRQDGKPDKTEIGKDNIIIDNSIFNNINKDLDNYNNNKNKRLSNDNPKAQDEELDFENSFYKLYPLKKGKTCAERAWKKLSHKDRQAAIDKLEAYMADCVLNKRSFKYPATYLNQRTWEDDFGVRQKISFYDQIEGDSDEKKRFKAWMRLNYPEIENTALPLSYEDYMAIIKESNVDAVSQYLEEISSEIFKYRKSDIASVVRQRIREDGL